ncbi:MAG: 50S ribosomal protein L11 [Actinobacteria bacterium 13_2_20CM_2_72_6]|nr:MAG: 50S ribosomal protein L11 [Actinobacteria bacterium 13_2_20CM_2_72_6]
MAARSVAAKSVLRRVKIELDAGNAGPAELGKMLGPYGLNLREIMVRYNEATAGQRGDRVPVEVTVFEDRSYALRFLAPPTSFLLRRAASGDTVTEEQVREIAQRKVPELNTDDLDAAMRTVAGTARSMGIRVKTSSGPDGPES